MRATRAELEAAAEPVLTDVNATGRGPARLEWENDPDGMEATLWDVDGTGTGVSLGDGWDRQVDAILHVADQVQNALLDDGAWPACPEHPEGHPLALADSDGRPIWQCPSSGHTIGIVGELAASLGPMSA